MQRVRSFFLTALLALACVATVAPRSPVALTGCRSAPAPVPTATDAGVYVPTGAWTDRVGQVLDYLQASGSRPGGIDLAMTVVELWPGVPPQDRAQVLASLREVRDTLLPELRNARDAYLRGDQSGRCRASRTVAAVAVALRGVSVTLARVMHWDVEDQLRFGLNLAAVLADELTPSCAADAGWSHLSNDTQRELSARAAPLRAFPTEDEARAAARHGGV